MSSIEKVLIHHLSAFGNNDLKEILKDYKEESQILTPDGVITGLADIRKFFEDFFAVVPSGSAFQMKQRRIVDNIAYIVWSSDSAVAEIPLGTDTLIFDGDAIKYHTVADYRIGK